MSDQFNITPASLDLSSQGMQRCQEDFAAAVERLRGRVLGAGSPWGQSAGGSMFGDIYTECTTVGLQALDHIGELLGGVATGLGQMSQNVQSGDQKNASNFDKVH